MIDIAQIKHAKAEFEVRSGKLDEDRVKIYFEDMEENIINVIGNYILKIPESTMQKYYNSMVSNNGRFYQRLRFDFIVYIYDTHVVDFIFNTFGRGDQFLIEDPYELFVHQEPTFTEIKDYIYFNKHFLIKDKQNVQYDVYNSRINKIIKDKLESFGLVIDNIEYGENHSTIYADVYIKNI